MHVGTVVIFQYEWRPKIMVMAMGKRVQRTLSRPFVKNGVSSSSGMTLLEIIIVVALLGTLMAILVRNLTDTADQAKIDQTKIAMGNIAQSLQLYRVHNNSYPTTSQGLDALVTNPGESPRWRGPYIEKDKLKDPWGNDFGYNSDGRKYEIISAGPDGQFETEDDIRYPERDENT